MTNPPSEIDTAVAPKPGKREQTKANNRRAFIEAGRLVFAQLGYGETTVRDIIRETGLASGTFYNYFKSKEEVFQAIMDENALQVRPRLRDERAKASTFEEWVRSMFFVFFDYVANDQRNFAIVRRNTGALRVRMDTPEIIAGFDELRVDLEKAVAAGIAPNVDVDYLSAAMIGIAFEMSDQLIMRDPPNVEEATDFATTLLLNGLAAMDGPRKT